MRKPRKLRILALLVLYGLLATQGSIPSQQATETPLALANGPLAAEFDPGVVLVKFKPEITASSIDVFLYSQGLTGATLLEGIGVRKITVPTGDEIETVARLSSNPLVEYAEPDYLEKLLWVPNDTYYVNFQWNMRKIGMEGAWDINRGIPSAKVGVIDSGLDLTNPDKPANITSPRNECLNNSDMYDLDGHGTHVSGIIAANTNNGRGVAGVAPGISLMPVKVDCAGTITVSRAASGIRYATDRGASVINYSLGSTEDSQTRRDAVNYALGKGVVFVAAAGNEYKEGNPVSYPAAYPGVLAVGASTYDDNRASYSQVQSYVGIVAPGGDPSGSNDTDWNHWVLSTYSNGYTAGLSGTSMAAPHVSGVAALIRSQSPNFGKGEVIDILQSTAADLGAPGKDDSFGYGRLDAFAAMREAARRSAYFAQFLGQSYPQSMVVGSKANISLTVRNAGSQTWYRDGPNPVRLATSSPQDRASLFYTIGDWLSPSRPAALGTSSVAPGQTASFNFQLTAPQTPGLYREYFRFVAEGQTWLNDLGLYFEINVIIPPYSAQISKQSYASYMLPGQTAQAWIEVKNTGSTTWFREGANPMRLGTANVKDRSSQFFTSGNWAAVNRPAKLDQPSIASGETGRFTFLLTAPLAPGFYDEYFEPIIEGTNWFDEATIRFQIRVSPDFDKSLYLPFLEKDLSG